MHLTAEVIGKFDPVGDANKLLYAPLAQKIEFRDSRRYQVEYSGSQPAVEAFLARVLANATSHELSTGTAPALAGWSLLLDYGMKPGALDLEKETILGYYRGLETPGFEIAKLNIERRIYLYGVSEADKSEIAEKFVRDIVNPAIHWHHVELATAA